VLRFPYVSQAHSFMNACVPSQIPFLCIPLLHPPVQAAELAAQQAAIAEQRERELRSAQQAVQQSQDARADVDDLISQLEFAWSAAAEASRLAARSRCLRPPPLHSQEKGCCLLTSPNPPVSCRRRVAAQRHVP
jgi:multidrug efflux pump subunit AcrA (membrane-fusion protein)